MKTHVADARRAVDDAAVHVLEELGAAPVVARVPIGRAAAVRALQLVVLHGADQDEVELQGEVQAGTTGGRKQVSVVGCVRVGDNQYCVRTHAPVLADDEHELLERRRGPVHLQVDDHVRQLREVELDALEDGLLVRVLRVGVVS